MLVVCLLLLQTFSDGDFESNDSGSPTSPRVIGEEVSEGGREGEREGGS